MAENTKIEWADHTFNPWIGCTKISPACDHCYAEGWAKRYGRAAWGTGNPRQRTSEHNWRLPLKWNAEAERTGIRPRVFCASLADVFDNEVPAEWRRDLFALIAATPHIDWLLLTKRIGNVRRMVPMEWLATALHGSHGQVLHPAGWPPHVWLGATVVNQAEADRDIPKLLDVPAAKRFLSIEPMLGPIQLRAYRSAGESPSSEPSWTRIGTARLDWIIVGGETGPGSRPMHPDWVRSLRDQCQAACVPFLFKQWGDHVEWDGSQSPNPSTRMDDLTPMVRVGKHAAGRLLDGREWNEVPE